MTDPIPFPTRPQPAVSLRGLTRRFGTNTVIDGLDLEIGDGEFVALLGRSGSGKTTLLRTLAGLDTATAGDAIVPASRAVVFQDARLLPWKRVWQNVALGLGGRDARARADAALAEVMLDHRGDAWPLTLSGGEAQRAALARALVRAPSLLLLDEPFAALDALTRLQMHDLVLGLWRRHAPAVLLITHDIDDGQWDYYRYYNTHFASAVADLDADKAASMASIYRRGDPSVMEKPAENARVTRSCVHRSAAQPWSRRRC
ncbi:sulfonate transport system ATP-binding protein [Sphingomonas gellani]|uniref:Sulfonate transport system ATP-binding protein n=1 Tax=Sphingomonas gellani TaxID=1166340 RepID=A0A1H8GFZ4_9SPHN|nr:ATP-binding cassette domain-containing protein [Sphingomonas gellani]SEN42883.1 sulfonate transport system ATP-binding protein [Sphingomonas gellani]